MERGGRRYCVRSTNINGQARKLILSYMKVLRIVKSRRCAFKATNLCCRHQRYCTMASPAEISPFTLAAVDAMRQLYPEGLADKSFDNTGLLLESPINKFRKNKLKNSVLLTIDVTTAVTDEAIEKEVSLIISYRKRSRSLS